MISVYGEKVGRLSSGWCVNVHVKEQRGVYVKVRAASCFAYLENACEKIFDHNHCFESAGHGATPMDDPQQPVGGGDHCCWSSS